MHCLLMQACRRDDINIGRRGFTVVMQQVSNNWVWVQYRFRLSELDFVNFQSQVWVLPYQVSKCQTVAFKKNNLKKILKIFDNFPLILKRYVKF